MTIADGHRRETNCFSAEGQRLPPVGKQCGFSLFELAIVLILVAGLTLVLADRLRYYQELAEKTAMETTVRNIKSGLNLQIATLIMQDKAAAIPGIALANPMRWLSPTPANYVGERHGNAVNVPPGAWYFDSARGEICYRVRQYRHFSNLAEDRTVRYRVIPGRSPEARPESQFKIVPVHTYQWF